MRNDGAMTAAPTPPPADNKNWTWVLDEVCPECEFDVRTFPVEEMGAMIRANAAEWAELLATGKNLRRRPDPDHWSPVEYACHVRDVYRLFDERLKMMLEQDDPTYPDWDQNATAVEDRYDRQKPADVAGQIVKAADALASRFDTVSGDQWDRAGRRSDGSVFTVATFARYLIHDPVHHLWDVRQG